MRGSTVITSGHMYWVVTFHQPSRAPNLSAFFSHGLQVKYDPDSVCRNCLVCLRLRQALEHAVWEWCACGSAGELKEEGRATIALPLAATQPSEHWGNTVEGCAYKYVDTEYQEAVLSQIAWNMASVMLTVIVLIVAVVATASPSDGGAFVIV